MRLLLAILATGLLFALDARAGELFDSTDAAARARLNPMPAPPRPLETGGKAPYYEALAFTCFPDGRCILSTGGQFASLRKCRAKLEVLEQIRYTVPTPEHHEGFCAVRGEYYLVEFLDFIQIHLDELAPVLWAIIERDKAAE